MYQVAVGNRGHATSALAAGRMWSVSKDWSQIQVGAAVYGYSSTDAGHVGIYIGNDMVAHNIGGVKIETLEHWVQYFKGVCWYGKTERIYPVILNTTVSADYYKRKAERALRLSPSILWDCKIKCVS